jgi:predicted HD superfamily hydrolase involved in NAD metabolism
MSLYSDEFEITIRNWALARIPTKRHAHILGVVSTADEMARRYLPDDRHRARLAGWLHDAAKHFSDDELRAACAKYGYQPTEGEHMVPSLLHGVVGYLIAADKFGVDDPPLMTACAFHTTGDPDMNTLDKIVLIADLIEPTRSFPGVDDIRRAAEHSLDGALLLSLDRTIHHLLDKGRIIDPRPIQLRNQLLQAGVAYFE